MKIFFFLLITLSASLCSHLPSGKFFIVWNVGQGQWLTLIDGPVCYHFDMGGEYFPWQKIVTFCKKRQNQVRLSHWDWDHIGALNKAPRLLPHICLADRPLGKSSTRKMKILARVSDCPVGSTTLTLARWSPASSKTANERSHVYAVGNFLIPGDSPANQEKLWADSNIFRQAQVLILGHHGSRHSTSEFLLRQNPQFLAAASSARFRRYQHPHSDVELRLRQHHVALIRTEDWGNLFFEIRHGDNKKPAP